MVLFFITTLCLSILGMVALLGLKRYELNTGKILLTRARPGMGIFFYNVVLWVEELPTLIKELSRRALAALSAFAHRIVAQGALWVEYALEKVLHVVREKTAPTRAEGEASAFLREVADHKKKLLRRSNRAIHEE